jgi:hypothetical protein
MRSRGRAALRQFDGVELSTPFVDATLPDGSRLHVVIPQITRQHMAVNICMFLGHSGRAEPTPASLLLGGTPTGRFYS